LKEVGEMADETQEKDNFWLIIGIIIAAAVVFVFWLKGQETASVKYQAWEEIRKEEMQKKK
jgi:uncharacterized integral membrane protein